MRVEDCKGRARLTEDTGSRGSAWKGRAAPERARGERPGSEGSPPIVSGENGGGRLPRGSPIAPVRGRPELPRNPWRSPVELERRRKESALGASGLLDWIGVKIYFVKQGNFEQKAMDGCDLLYFFSTHKMHEIYKIENMYFRDN